MGIFRLSRGERKGSLSLSLFIGVIFVFGFIFQILGVLSITQTNLLALVLLCLYLVINGRVNFRFNHNTCVFALAMLIFFFIGIANGSSLQGFFVYFYYFLTVLLVLLAASISVRSGHVTVRYLEGWIPIYLLVQIAVCVTQKIFANEIITFSRTSLSIEDTVSGTFYLASDASLAFLCIFINVFMFSIRSSWSKTLFVTALSGAVVFLTNSKAMQLLFVLAVGGSMLWRVFGMVLGLRVILIVLAIVASAIGVVLAYDNITALLGDFESTLRIAYDRRLLGTSAHRLAPIGELLFIDISWLGRGFLTYFNPVTKEWLYYSGFSSLYTIYIDCGLLGLMVVYGSFLYFTLTQSTSRFYGLMCFGVFVTFSLFNFALIDISVLYVFFLLMYLGKSVVNE